MSCVQRKTTKGTPIAERQRSTAYSCEGPTARERTRRRIRPAAQATGNPRTKSEEKTTRRHCATGNACSGQERKVVQGSHTVSLQGNAGPSDGDIGGTQRQAANQDRQVAASVSREDMVYPLNGNSASNHEVPPEYSVGEPPVVKPSEGSTDADVGGISSVVRIRGIVIALAGRIRGRNIRVLVDSGSTGNYASAQCQAEMDLEVQPERDFERLTLADGSEVHAQGYVRFALHCGDYNCKILACVFPNL